MQIRSAGTPRPLTLSQTVSSLYLKVTANNVTSLSVKTWWEKTGFHTNLPFSHSRLRLDRYLSCTLEKTEPCIQPTILKKDFLEYWAVLHVPFKKNIMYFFAPYGKFGSPYLNKAQQLQEQCYPFLAVFLCVCVQTMVWLPVFTIFNMPTDIDYSSTTTCYTQQPVFGVFVRTFSHHSGLRLRWQNCLKPPKRFIFFK